ncbi:MAG: helix-turn-helix domain-containing protein [Nitratireductor sp.]
MFGDLLKKWRNVRRLSQLELGLEANVSARHISFLETQRAKPSRSMVLHLADVLKIPFTDRNLLLSAAGFSTQFKKRKLSDEEMRPVREAISWTMEQHSPYPAMILDRHWKVLDANKCARTLINAFGMQVGDSMLEAILDPNGVRNAIDNWSQIHPFLLARLRMENDHLGGDEILHKAIQVLDDGKLDNFSNDERAFSPVLPMKFNLGGQKLSLFSTIAQFGTAEELALSEYILELFFPFDEDTKKLLVKME